MFDIAGHFNINILTRTDRKHRTDTKVKIKCYTDKNITCNKDIVESFLLGTGSFIGINKLVVG